MQLCSAPLMLDGERGGSLVECPTWERASWVRNLPPPCCVLEQDTLLAKSRCTGNTQEAVVPSQHE